MIFPVAPESIFTVTCRLPVPPAESAPSGHETVPVDPTEGCEHEAPETETNVVEGGVTKSTAAADAPPVPPFV